MKRIYVSYRREDTSDSYGRIVERLRNYFGSEATLRSDSTYTADGVGISPAEYRVYVAEAMKRCAALLLVIGPRWLASDRPDDWRLSDLDDPVRIEIEAALRAGVPIVPVTVQQAHMPTAEELPASLRLLLEQGQEHGGRRRRESLLALVSRAGLPVRRDPDFGGDTQRLCEVIENLAGLEATSLERASGLVNRTVRNVTLLAASALIIHVAVLAYFAYQSVIPLRPSLIIPAGWLPQVMLSALIDWGVYFLAGYVAARRTGDTGLGVSAAVTACVAGIFVEIALFADITWAKWILLSAPIPTPDLLNGAPDWLLGPALLFMHPFMLLFAVLVLGIPVSMAASFALGTLGGILGARVTEAIASLQRERGRKALLREAGAPGGLRAALARRRDASGPSVRRGAVAAGKVFISYRRDDSAVMCGSVYDRLTEVFGLDTIFKDVDMIPVGVNFARFIDSTLKQCVAQVVVIGPRWVSITTEQGERRLDSPTDFVRLEVESALKSGLKVIPALVQGATMPSREELPEGLRLLADLTPINVGYAPAFDDDMRALGLALATVVWPAPTRWGWLKRAIVSRRGQRATQVAANLWFAALTAYGIALGVEVTRGLALRDAVGGDLPILTFVGIAPVLLTSLTLLSGAHLGYHTGRTGRAFWLSWRATLAACAALTLTVFARGATLYANLSSAGQDVYYRGTALGALAASALIAVGPGMVTALVGAALVSFLRRRRDRAGLLSSGPSAIQVLRHSDDARVAAGITTGLVAAFGRQALPRSRYRLQDLTPRPTVVDRITTLVTQRVLPLAGRRTLVADVERASEIDARLLTRALRRSAAVLVLVGPEWSPGGSALSALADPKYQLRTQVEAALAVGCPVIPVLLTDATMPAPDLLPPSMREFAMLNAAWVRAAPDFAGDMRRLVRVIERVTRLRTVQPIRESIFWVDGGGLLTALLLVGLDLFVARAVLGAFARYTQTGLLATGGALIAADLLICGIAGGVVTSWNGKRGQGALAAILGAALALLAGAVTLRLGIGDFGTRWSVLVRTLVGISALSQQAIGALSLFLVARVPFQTLGVLATSALGSLYGAVVHRARQRAIQERALYEMARVATSGASLAEMSSRSARVTGAPAPAAPEPALAAELALIASSGVATDSLPTPSSDPEESRRDALLAQIRAAKTAARIRSRIRLGIIGGVLITALVVTTLVGGQAYSYQIRGFTIDSAAVNATATVAARQTAVVQLTPYRAAAPGQVCDTGAGTWAISDSLSTGIVCSDTYAIYDTDSNYGRHLVAQELTLNRPFVSQYALAVDISLTYSTGCAGLMSNGDRTGLGSAFSFEICAHGTWRVNFYHSIDFDLNTLTSHTTSFSIRSGNIRLRPTNALEVIVAPNQARFVINGTVVATIIDTRLASPTAFVGICVNWSSPYDVDASARFSGFEYTPIQL
ncbi:MAG TPA: TIR domain-containing protein [Ktedonobacterales bacterium]